MKQAINIIVSGGGTGGHIYPAIAIARAIQRLAPDTKILFIGANGRMEMEKVPAAGFDIKGIDIMGLQRKLSAKNILLPYYVLKSFFQVKQIFKSFNPDVVIGTGGYVSFPVLAVAQWLNIPTYIQEQNAYAGLANKLLAKRSKKIFVAFDNMQQFFSKDKIKITGNPVREDLTSISDKRNEAFKHFSLNPEKKVVLVLGGSLGAKTINQAIADNLKYFTENDIQLIWQTGKNFYSQINSSDDLKNKLSNKLFFCKDFIYEMDLAYAVADVIISRAGASTIAELQVVGKPAILIPSPNVTADHQTKNALSLVQKNAAILVKDEDASKQLINQLDKLLKDNTLQETLSQNIKQPANPYAARDIAKEILNDLNHTAHNL